MGATPMMDDIVPQELKEAGKEIAMELGKVPDECAVKGCEGEQVQVVTLKPFDPIDHGPTKLQLCDSHIQWAEERNAFAEQIIQELRDRRAKLAEEYLDEIQRLETPPESEQ